MKIAIAAVVLAFASGAYAQEQFVCQYVGAPGPEPLAEGRAVQVNNFSCVVKGGVMDGGVLTGIQAYEFKGPEGKMVIGSGVIRAPGAITMYQTQDASLSIAMKDGKPTGATGQGKGVMKLASGKAAEFAGKTYTYKVKTTGPASFVIDVTWDK